MPRKELRLQRKINGLCPTCGKVADRAEYYECSGCAEKHKMQRKKRIENGICVRCGNPNNNGKTLCDICVERQRKNSEIYRIQKRKNGICVDCGKFTAAPNRSRCEFCLAKRAEEVSVRHENMNDAELDAYRKKKNAYERKMMNEARENGLCIYCRKRKPAQGKKACTECLVKFRKWNRSYKAKRKKFPSYEECIEQGICTTCRARKATHKKLCETCYDKNMESLKKANAAPRKSEHFWVQDNRAILFAKG